MPQLTGDPETADPKARFSDRVEDYVKYRPRYQNNVIEGLREACGLRPEHVVADVGCGTGLSAEIFLRNGNRVFGVEPNAEMRRAGEEYLRDYPNFTMVDGSAEHTNLAADSMDFVVAGQAFHWFRPGEAGAEFARIVRREGWVALIWHDRNLDATPFLRDYEAFLRRHGTDYDKVAHRYVASYEVLRRFFAPHEVKLIRLKNSQHLDLEGLRGRLLSSSYMPREGENAEAMLRELPALFSSHAEGGQVTLEYDTNIYYGRLHA